MICASCGLALVGDQTLCLQHHMSAGDDWSTSNRVMCDFLHRKKVPERLSAEQRDDNLYTVQCG